MHYSIKREGKFTHVRIDFGNNTVYRGYLDDKELSALCSTLFDVIREVECTQGEYTNETSDN